MAKKPSELERKRANIAAAANPDTPVVPYPPTLRDELRPYWLAAVNTKPGDYWEASDVPLLTLYCRTAYDIDRLTDEILEEGEVLYTMKGTPVVNPKIVIRGFAEARFLGVCAKLKLQPSTRGNSEIEKTQNKRTKTARAAAAALQEAGEEGGDDSLLAGFNGNVTPLRKTK